MHLEPRFHAGPFTEAHAFRDADTRQRFREHLIKAGTARIGSTTREKFSAACAALVGARPVRGVIVATRPPRSATLRYSPPASPQNWVAPDCVAMLAVHGRQRLELVADAAYAAPTGTHRTRNSRRTCRGSGVVPR